VSSSADRAAGSLRTLLSAAGIRQWALWVVSPALGFAAGDLVERIAGFRPDTTTLIMRALLRESGNADGHVARTSVATVMLATDEPVPLQEVEEPGRLAGGLEAWVLIQDGLAVSGAAMPELS
jgi:hypothetical protein